jgi:hypothetical protein
MDDLNTPTVSVIMKRVRSFIGFYNWRPNTQGRDLKEMRRHFQKKKEQKDKLRKLHERRQWRNEEMRLHFAEDQGKSEVAFLIHVT